MSINKNKRPQTIAEFLSLLGEEKPSQQQQKQHVKVDEPVIVSEETMVISEKEEKPTIKQPCPESNLIWAILCSAMCCVPLGIVAVFKASSVDKLWHQGKYDEAQKAANDAKKFSIIGAACSAVFVVLYIILVVVMTLAEM